MESVLCLLFPRHNVRLRRRAGFLFPMKRFLWLVILAAAGYAVWKYYPEIEHRARLLTEEFPASSAPEEDPLAGSAEGAEEMPAAEAKKPAAVEPEDDIARRYPLPEFKPIEELVGGWKAIPASAFPRQVTLKAPARLQLAGGVGHSTLEAGRKVFALSSAGEGTILVAPSADGVMRGEVKIDDTDFKAELARVYDQFKKRKETEVLRLREQARAAEKNRGPSLAAALVAEPAPPPPATLATIGPKPVQNSDLTVPAAVASIQERQRASKNAEPPLADIISWQPVRFQEIKGEPYWAVGVRYTARTIFGEFPTDAIALLRHGKVVRWIYAGSGEPLPGA